MSLRPSGRKFGPSSWRRHSCLLRRDSFRRLRLRLRLPRGARPWPAHGLRRPLFSGLLVKLAGSPAQAEGLPTSASRTLRAEVSGEIVKNRLAVRRA